MRKRLPVLPAVEPLDSKLLLSTIAPASASHSPTSAQIHAERHASPVTVDLQGTIRIVATLTSNDSQATLVGSGHLGGVGVASIRTKFHALMSPGTHVLSTSHGNIDYTASAHVTQSAGSIIGSVGTYKITGGTGSYAHATGTGVISVAVTSISGSKVVFDESFS